MKDGFLKAAAAAPKIRVADPAWNALEICKKNRLYKISFKESRLYS